MQRRFGILILCLLLALAAGFFGLRSNHATARIKKSTPPPVAAITPPATNNSIAAAKKFSQLATGTNRYAFRLTNTKKTLAELTTDPHAILLQNAYIDTVGQVSALKIPEALKSKGDPGAYIVQARSAIGPQFRSVLAAVGAKIVSYIPNNAYLVQVTANGAGMLAANSLVLAVLPYEPYYKLQPSLLGLAVDGEDLPPGVALNLGLFAANATATEQALQQQGAKIIGSDSSPFGPIVRVLAPENWISLAQFPGVQAVEVAHQRKVANDLARVTLGISADTITPTNYLNLNGANVMVEVNDTGLDAQHPDLGTNRMFGDTLQSLTDTNGHGTHVAGIIAGNGAESLTLSVRPPQGSLAGANYRGKAPLAKLYSVAGVTGGNDTNYISDQYFQEQPAQTNALISNNSWAYVGDYDYDLASASYDAATRDALPLNTGSQPVLFVFAAGNDGGGNSDGTGGDADTIQSPGTAKNVITVGALEQLRNITNIVIDANTNSSAVWKPETDSSSQVADYSARGNVGINLEGPYGRFKPDVVAPGSFVVSTRSEQWDTNAYYNPTNISTIYYANQVSTTNALNYYNVSVPADAVSVTINIITNQYSTSFPNLIIYGQLNGYPDPVNAPGSIDVITSNNMLAIPPGGGNLTITNIVNNGFDFAVGDSISGVVNYDMTVTIATTNNVGNYYQVLDGLNETLAPWYRYESGTSMSTPAISGVLALIQDFFTNTMHQTPSPALLKAMLINGSRAVGSYTYAITNGNNFQGWGLPNIQNSLPLTAGALPMTPANMGSTNSPIFFVDQSPANALATGDSQTYTIDLNMDPNAQYYNLQATLVWTDPAGDPAAAIKLVNNLDLVITNLTTGDVYFGNDISSQLGYNLPWSTNTTPNLDTINNVENIIIPPLLGGRYSVTIIGRNVNVNAVTAQTNNVVQDYALVVTVGEGEVPNAFTVENGGVPTTVSNPTGDQQITYVGTTNSPLYNQFVGASSPFVGTNTLPLGTNTIWGSNGQLTVGTTNQWHFYVVTNTGTSSDYTNAAFITFGAEDLSVPRMGVYSEADPANATRPEADIDLYATTDPALTNLSLVTISNCLAGLNNSSASISRGGTEFVYFTNSAPGQVYYIGVKSEDQMASEFDFMPLFTDKPFGGIDQNGNQIVNGLLLPALIPDGSPAHPGVANVFALAVTPMTVEKVQVYNLNQHQNFGDLMGTLSFGGSSVVLNNHDGLGDTYTTATPILYDDSANPTNGSQHTDGPGSLTGFRGQSATGPWILNEIDNALTHTGQVSQFSLLIQPHRDFTGRGIIVTVPPQGWFIDYVVVPPGYTNLTFYATNLPPTIGPPPLQMYEKFGDEPTLTSFDSEADLTNCIIGTYPTGTDPGNLISVGPPLANGDYFIGIYNPSSVAATNVFLQATLGINTSGSDVYNYTSTNGPQVLNSDAVTISSAISVAATQLVESVNVGIAVQSPQISDYTFTLVSPTGQRVLLMENRGGNDTNGAGLPFTYTNVLNSVATGTAAANTNYLAVMSGEAVPISYNFYTVPDEMTIYSGTNPASFYLGSPDFLYDTGFTNGTGNIIVNIPPGFTNMTIIMNQFGNTNDSEGGDAWTYTAGSSITNYQYLVFTDDTNLSNVPIKYAVPPYNFVSSTTNFTLSDFESATNGIYYGPTTNLDGWTVPTNVIAYTTVLNLTNNQFETVSNNIAFTNNFVSVVTDPYDSVGDNGGTNYLALADGTITRDIPTIPGRQYNVTFWYRGPGISGWWRGEGNASDSSDPENDGNNGTLVGRFNFPAGEVGQAFQFEDGGNEFQFAGTNTYVQIPQNPSLDVGKGSGFTVEGWINPTNLSQPQPLVEWLAHVPTNTAITNIIIQAGPYYNPSTGHYYYLLGATNWPTSELWATELGGHLATVNTANEQNWIFDNFADYGGFNHNLWIGLTNTAGANFAWSSGEANVAYTNWLSGQPSNPDNIRNYTGMLGDTNVEAGLWVAADANGFIFGSAATNKFYGVAEVDQIQTNGVQFWISATNTPGTTNAAFVSSNGCLYANIIDTNFVSHEIYSAAGLLQSNIYQHVALTYDTNSGLAILYLNGTNVASTNFGLIAPIIAKTDGDVLLGRDMSPYTNHYYGGKMDEMSIYRRALSPAEIKTIYQVSAFATNGTTGKFDPAVTPAFGLAEAEVYFGSNSNLIFGLNNQWELNSYTFTAISNSMTLRITGLQPGILLDDFSVSDAPLTNLYYLPEQSLDAFVGSSAFGNWTLQVWDNLNNTAVTNLSQLLSWQLSFVLESNATFAASLAPETPSTNTVGPGQTLYYTVNVPSWANFSTNILVSSTGPVDLLFNPTNLPTGSNPGDVTLLAASTGGFPAGVSQAITVNADPPFATPFQAGQTYYLAVRNNGTSPASVVLQVDYDITVLTNGVPFSSLLNTNDSTRYFSYNVSTNAYETVFQLLKLSGNADLVVRKGLPLPTLTNTDYGSFNVSNLDEKIYVLTNSTPVPLSPGTWYIGVIKRDSGIVNYSVLVHELDVTNGVTNSVSIINLTNGVPFNFTAGPGAALTNFFCFTVTNTVTSTVTNYLQGLRFELYNLTGNGDLTLQTNALPLAPPFFESSQNRGHTPELITVYTNSALTNLAGSWYLGVPNNEVSNINYTILAVIDTNSYFPAFPGAAGAGGGAIGGNLGFTGTVYHVTTTADSGFGSLRDAVSVTNRTVVFDVSGTIALASPLVITNSYLTIAGQTAPGDGITVAGNVTTVTNVHDVIIRDVRFRSGGAADSLEFINASNLIADHISVSWSLDNLVSAFNSTNLTVQWSIMADSLYNSNSPNGFGSLLRYGSGALSFHHNLYADNYNASPRLGDNVSLDFVNNVIYNWGLQSGFSSTNDDQIVNPNGFTNQLNYVCNYLIAGPDTALFATNLDITNIAFVGGTTNTWIFQTNNFIDSNINGILDGANTQWAMFTNQYTAFQHPFPLLPVPTDEAFLAYEKVMDFAGVNSAMRDSVDTSLAFKVRAQNGRLISTPISDMAAWWKGENNALDTIGSNNGTLINGTYTNGEVGNAFSFKGAGSYVSVPDSPLLDSFSNSITVEVWMKSNRLTANPDWVGLVTKGNTSWRLQATSYANTVYFGMNGVTPVDLYGTRNVNDGQWHHVAAVYDGTHTFLYVDGTLDVSQPATGLIAQDTDPLCIGATSGAYELSCSCIELGYFFDGAADEVSLYHRALSAAEIKATYTAGHVGKFNTQPGLVFKDTDQDGIPDFWESTFGQSLTNANNNVLTTNADFIGYTDLEEYENWLAGPHALTVTNTPVSIDLMQLFGNTGNLSFSVSNSVNGSVYLTNYLTNIWGSVTKSGPWSNTIAVFAPTNTAPPFSGYASFDVYVTNNDTVAYFGPVKVSVVVSSLPITYFTGLNTNPPVFTLTNGIGQTNDISPGGIEYYLINVPTNADFATNTLFSLNGGNLNVWYSTNVPPTIGVGNDKFLFVGTNNSDVLNIGGVPPLMPGTVYYLGVVNTNNFNVDYEIGVNFHLATNVIVPPLTNTVAIAGIVSTNIGGKNGFLLTWFAPSNDLFRVQWTTSLAPASWTTFTNIVSYNPAAFTNPTNTQFNFFDDGTQTGGFGPTRFYRLILLQSTNPPPPTNTVPINSIISTNITGTNGFLLTWFAPSNYLFQVQGTTNLVPANWITFTNPPFISYNTNFSPNPTNSRFNFFDNGSQFPFGPTRFYRLILYNGSALPSGFTWPTPSNLVTGVGVLSIVTNAAADSNPSAILSYVLIASPTNSATIANGVITWTPPAPATNTLATFTTIVSDSGPPSFKATNSFTVFVAPIPAISSALVATNGVKLQWFAATNEQFQVEWATNLSPIVWFTFPGILTSSNGTFNFMDTNNTAAVMKFYRLWLLP